MPYRVLKRRSNKTGEKSFKAYDFDKHHEGVRYRRRVTVLPSAVQKVYHDWVSSIYQGSYQKENKITLGEVVQKYHSFCEQTKSRRETMRTKFQLNYFVKFFNKDKKVGSIVIDEADEFCSELRRKYPNANSYNRALGVVRAFLGYCEKRDYGISAKLLYGRSRRAAKREMVVA